MIIGNDDGCFLNVNLDWHFVWLLDFLECRLNLKVNKLYDFLQNVFIDIILRKLKHRNMIRESFSDLFLYLVNCRKALGIKYSTRVSAYYHGLNIHLFKLFHSFFWIFSLCENLLVAFYIHSKLVFQFNDFSDEKGANFFLVWILQVNDKIFQIG